MKEFKRTKTDGDEKTRNSKHQETNGEEEFQFVKIDNKKHSENAQQPYESNVAKRRHPGVTFAPHRTPTKVIHTF